MRTNANEAIVIDWLNFADPRQMVQVRQVLASTGADPRSINEFRTRYQGEAVGIFAAVGGRIVGVLVYGFYDAGRVIHVIAVEARMQRQGIGRALITAMLREIAMDPGVQEVAAVVSEMWLAVQAFFRAMSFRVTETIKEEGVRDLYLFTTTREAQCDARSGTKVLVEA